MGLWVQVNGGLVTESDVDVWSYSVSILCQFTSFWGSLHWPADSGDFGHGFPTLMF